MPIGLPKNQSWPRCTAQSEIMARQSPRLPVSNPAPEYQQLPLSDDFSAPDLSSPGMNQMRAADRPGHDWYRFVLSYPPHLVKDYLVQFDIQPGQRVLDPFCGTGTTVLECKKNGIESVGVEANPMAQFAGSVKLDWTVDPEQLRTEAAAIAAAAQAAIDSAPTLRTLPPESAQLLLKNSISPLPLHKTLILQDHIPKTSPIYRHAKLALAKALVTEVGNLYFGPEVGIGKAKPDAPVVSAWLGWVEAIARDLEILRNLPQSPAQIHHQIHHHDARHILDVLEPNSVDAVITSPPYPNEKDYTRATRLESVILGFLADRADLRTLKQGLVRSNTRNVYAADREDAWVARQPQVQEIATEIERRRIEQGKKSGFERYYARATKLYFGGMAQHLADLRTILRPGAQLAYVVGDQASYLQVMIRTGDILADIAAGLGYEVMDVKLFRTRIASKTQEQMREEVVLLRWPGTMPTQPYPYGDNSGA
jgi:SAM-dependent methyltransferase